MTIPDIIVGRKCSTFSYNRKFLLRHNTAQIYIVKKYLKSLCCWIDQFEFQEILLKLFSRYEWQKLFSLGRKSKFEFILIIFISLLSFPWHDMDDNVSGGENLNSGDFHYHEMQIQSLIHIRVVVCWWNFFTWKLLLTSWIFHRNEDERLFHLSE